MDFGRALKIIRSIYGLSQEELGNKLNVSKSLISKIESGDRLFSQRNLLAVSKALNIPENLIRILAYKSDRKVRANKFTENEAINLGMHILKVLNSLNGR